MDKLNSTLTRCWRRRGNISDAGVFPMNLPINPGPGFNQVLDVLRNEIVTYDTRARTENSPKPQPPGNGRTKSNNFTPN